MRGAALPPTEEIVAPVDVLCFDDTVYRMLGSKLEALTAEAESLLEPNTYGKARTAKLQAPRRAGVGDHLHPLVVTRSRQTWAIEEIALVVSGRRAKSHRRRWNCRSFHVSPTRTGTRTRSLRGKSAVCSP